MYCHHFIFADRFLRGNVSSFGGEYPPRWPVEVSRWRARIPTVLDRRSVLRRGAGALGTATLASAAGCLFDGGSDDGSSGDFLASLPDPTPSVVPNFHAAYAYDPATLRNNLGADPMPELASRLVAVIGEMQGTGVDDLDRLSGQTIRQVGHSGDEVELVSPRGTDLVAEGSVDVGGAAGWLLDQGLEDLGDARGYRRLGNGGPIVEGFAVDGEALTFGNREGTGESAADVASAAIDGLESAAVPAAEFSPELHATVGELPSGVATIATEFDLVAERPDTGTEAYDGTAASLVAAGLSASVDDDETEVTRVLRYRRDRVASPNDVQSAVDAAAAEGHFHDADWTVSASGRSVWIEGSVSTATLEDDPAALRRAVPVPGYDDLTVPTDPTALGRDPPPRVGWQPTLLDDGRLAVVHGGGPSVEDLEVAYSVDGERRHEPWEGPVEPDDRFETAEPPDGGSYLDLVWARGTVDETILVRIQLPADDG